MLHLLLDIAYPGRPRHPRIPVRRDTLERIPVKEQTDTVAQADTVVSQSPVDTLTSNVPVDSVPATQSDSLSWFQNLVTPGSSGDDSSMLLWAIVIVAAVLMLCLYLARTYRLQSRLHA